MKYESALKQYYIVKDSFVLNNTVLFQKPRDYNKTYEEERWEIRFEVSFNPCVLKIWTFHQYEESDTRSASKQFVL